MKKIAFLVGIALIGVAFASSVNVPFFVDVAGTTWASGRPDGPGPAGIIAVKNNTGSTITATVVYRDGLGAPLGPAGPADNTFLITAGQGIAWRPCRIDTVQEGPLGTGGHLVPNMNTTGGTGSCEIKWTLVTSPRDIQGRYLQINSEIGGAAGMYTLPEGI